MAIRIRPAWSLSAPEQAPQLSRREASFAQSGAERAGRGGIVFGDTFTVAYLRAG